jgi:hypothetical protein
MTVFTQWLLLLAWINSQNRITSPTKKAASGWRSLTKKNDLTVKTSVTTEAASGWQSLDRRLFNKENISHPISSLRLAKSA